ncbi:MAG: hypothetical protein ACYTGN_06990 [Planctomycetota bacterium]|jgi:hypothetical protein
MRALFLLVATLCACGSDPAPAAPPSDSNEAWPIDGFLRHLPQEWSLVARLPVHDAKAPAIDALTRALDRPELCAALPGLDPDRAPGAVATPKGGWIRYYPARDKAKLNAALSDQLRQAAHREEQDWVMLSYGGATAGSAEGEPLPPGDAALRLRYHPAVDAAFQPGDALEAAVTLGPGGFEFSGRLRPTERSATRRRVTAAGVLDGDLVDLLPKSLALRVETTLPAAELASFLTRRIASHGGVAADEDRVKIERFLREVLTGADAPSGFAFGIEVHESGTSVVATGRVAGGLDSPLLLGTRERTRTTIGPLVLDLRRETPEGVLGFTAWLIDAKPRLDGVPEAAWRMVGDLASEDAGVPIAFAREDDWFVLAAGRRADRLTQLVRKSLRSGSSRSAASRALRAARERGQGDYVLGIAINALGLRSLPINDKGALRAMLGAGPAATGIRVLGIAGFRDGEELRIEGRGLYR